MLTCKLDLILEMCVPVILWIEVGKDHGCLCEQGKVPPWTSLGVRKNTTTKRWGSSLSYIVIRFETKVVYYLAK